MTPHRLQTIHLFQDPLPQLFYLPNEMGLPLLLYLPILHLLAITHFEEVQTNPLPFLLPEVLHLLLLTAQEQQVISTFLICTVQVQCIPF